MGWTPAPGNSQLTPEGRDVLTEIESLQTEERHEFSWSTLCMRNFFNREFMQGRGQHLGASEHLFVACLGPFQADQREAVCS